jgi:hypothetical protein
MRQDIVFYDKTIFCPKSGFLGLHRGSVFRDGYLSEAVVKGIMAILAGAHSVMAQNLYVIIAGVLVRKIR